MKNCLILIAAAILFTGCATVEKMPLAGNGAAALMNKTLAHTVYPLPSFTAMTPTKVALGPFGAVAMVTEGNEIIRGAGIEDPAAAIAGDLAAILEGEYGSQTVAAPISVNGNSPDALAAAGAGTAQYVLDVRTFMWHMAYFPTDWGHYRLAYAATARLVDTSTKAVLSQASCKYYPESNVGAPTYDEMTANNAQRLKAELAQAARACFVSLKADMFQL